MAALLDDSCMGQMQRSHSLDSFLAATQLTQLKQVKAKSYNRIDATIIDKTRN